MNNPRYQLERRLEELLAANFPQWIWELQSGANIGVVRYQGSWTPPGTQEIFPARFVCISGNKVYYVEENGQIGSTAWGDSIRSIEMLKEHIKDIEAYRQKNPDWATTGM